MSKQTAGLFNKVLISFNNIGVAKYLKNWRYRYKGDLKLKNFEFKNNKINEFDGKNKIFADVDI